MKLTFESLEQEYMSWKALYGIGRNDDDLRFGQYIHITYDLPSNVEVFYVENANRTYDILTTWLKERQNQMAI